MISILKKSPIKFMKPRKETKTNQKDLAGFVIISWIKGKISFILLGIMNDIKKYNILKYSRTNKEIKFTIRPDSKYFKSDLIKVKICDLMNSFMSWYQSRLVLFAFKLLASKAENGKVSKSIFVVIRSLALARVKYAFSVVQEYDIQIYYLHKRMKIDAKIHKKRYSDGFGLLMSIYRLRTSKLFSKMISLYRCAPNIKSISSICSLSQMHSRIKLKLMLNKLKKSTS